MPDSPSAKAVHPREALYAGEKAVPAIPACDHYAGSERFIVKALEHAHREGRGVVVVNGRLIEHHHLKAARRLLALADMIKSLEAGQ